MVAADGDDAIVSAANTLPDGVAKARLERIADLFESGAFTSRGRHLAVGGDQQSRSVDSLARPARRLGHVAHHGLVSEPVAG